MSQAELSSRSDADEPCPHCRGVEGFHLMSCPGRAEATQVQSEDPPEYVLEGPGFDGGMDVQPGGFDEQKLPPSGDELIGNEMLWLVAKTCHEVNRTYCREILMDTTQRHWSDAPEHQRLSTYNGVVYLFENPKATAEDCHKSWMKFKQEAGWTYSPIKDPRAKTHPSLMPYLELHPQERAKDALFVTVCRAMFGD